MTMRLTALVMILLSLSACEQLAVQTTPKRVAHSSRSQLASNAEKMFWDTLHSGHYQDIPEVRTQLMAAYLQNPDDPALAAHLGFLNMWSITERERLKTIPPTIVNDIVLAKFYFGSAVELEPGDARYLGFYGDSRLVIGQIFNDQREEVHGYFTLKKAIHAWPEFNYFTGGYVMSTLPPESKRYKQGLEWQWATLDLCAGERVNRNNPDFAPYMQRETKTGPQRACWNSWIAPHNFEGFFLNMGDMLVKAGDWKTAIRIYHNAQLSKNYSTWPYRILLENRIANAKNNVSNFQKDYTSPEKTIMFNSGYGCMACHQVR